MRILVTGGAGFIGSHLVRHFVTAGHDVIIADRFTYAGKGRRLGNLLRQCPLLIGDLAQGDLPARCVEAEPDVVIHTAAETHVDRSILDPTSFLVANPLGTSRLLDAFAQSSPLSHRQVHGTCCMPKLPRFVLYSTDEVYGPSASPVETRVERDPYNPSNAYSASKVAVEAVANAYRVTHDLDLLVVRPCNVYGRGQHPEKAIPKWTGQILRGEPATIYNDGQGFRDWMHTSDHCSAIERIITHWGDATPARRLRTPAFNLARFDFRTDMEVFLQLRVTLGKPDAPHVLVPGRPGHDRGYAMSRDKLWSLGHRPRVEFAEGLADAVDYIQAYPDFWVHDMAGMF